jgi:hypothetical protein
MPQICEVWVGIRRGGEKTLAAAATPLNQKRDEVAGSGGPGLPYACASAAPVQTALQASVPRPTARRGRRASVAWRAPVRGSATPQPRAQHLYVQRRHRGRGTGARIKPPRLARAGHFVPLPWLRGVAAAARVSLPLF